MSGIIYLIQPAELVGTKRYKIGCSKKSTLDRVKKGYKKGTRYLHIAECEEPHKIESSIKTIFNDKFKLIAGHEYYEGDESDIKQEFINIINNQNNKNDNDDNVTFEDLPMFIQVLLDRKLIDKKGNEYFDNCSLFWTKIDNINSVQIEQYKKTNAQFYNFDEININETVINFTDNFCENEIDIIKKHNLHSVESIIRNNNIDKNEKNRVIKCYKYVIERYELLNIEPPNGQTCLTLNNILFVILINHKGGITFIQKNPGKMEDYHIISMN